ncbi:DNA repair protein-like protein Ntg1 [Westerdykella ornata]|uniref:Endonuclease III homolog n=1 Tax=Westerdykella ornata TaxID=318751 RepID=A0A6A6J8F4_WESOR|nr:DNA repair protein-like protein Ntg1 [Westerdykella ornata]KAF2272527.1 DNA repair protein-like protein Ntg1 [Westerdykella ornata]
MRTSRLSRDAAKIASALTGSRASSRIRQTRAGAKANIRDFALNAAEAGNVTRGEAGKPEAALGNGDNGSDSELSSVPEGSEWEDGETTTRKRKRGETPVKATVKLETEEITITESASPRNATSRPKKARRLPAKNRAGPGANVKVEPPPNWEEIYALTREMRNENVAPVDTMGCESLADRNASPRDQRFQTLVSLMLSSQTKDTVTSATIKGMQARMPGGFNLESVLAIEPAALNAFINKVGFHNLKTKYIKATAEILRDKWDSDIPDTIEGLVSLPGVGPKMAYLCAAAAWGKVEGIGVDVHVHRITNLWKWHKTKTPEETRAALETWLPKSHWHDINNLLVGFGQTICLPVGRKCGECRLAERGLCPSAVVGTSRKIKKETAVLEAEVPDGLVIKKEERLVVGRGDIEADVGDVKAMIPDIEDLGRSEHMRRRKNLREGSRETF